mmetsp:Transcript_7381/g.11723  ORF Transcript_7381/g.11723 Transcript_7381/m.11723 type:complete len:753 (+) Transcript_7381:132-2390(+)|eukprot:CAMPEP_0184664676 /NCGR_PEP_ID=MMETSP0308-20130426/53887_1 /TAXON_ID=38269 /ORGANISM="Gloeochaete witrockiana, Strain SAG 46.84" /LENGTH=752 /DNA_ID=CAMNT_0027108221 /DNA_START=66 /DNA_END=2324 /DNA_ORIENTATION=+
MSSKKVTPYQVAICELLHEYLTSDDFSPEEKQELVVFLLKEIKGIDQCVEKTFSDIVSCLEPTAPNVVESLEWRFETFESPDHLICFFQGTLAELLLKPESLDGSQGIAPGLLEKKSPFGVYLRRVILNFRNMSFEEVGRLFDQLKGYRSVNSQQETKGILLKPLLNPFLDHEIEKLERTIGVTSPSERNRMLSLLLEKEPFAAKAYLLRFLNAVNHMEFEMAVDNMHRYFDYATTNAIIPPKPPTASPAEEKAPPPPPAPGSIASLHNAVQSLAGLHYRFGHIDNALQAINETVRIAQSNNDHACLAYGLAWLSRISSSTDAHGLNEKLLRRCLSRAQELNLSSLAALCSLSLSNLELRSLRRISQPGSRDAFTMATLPLQAMELLREGVSRVAWDPASQQTQAASLVLRSNTWKTLGSQALSDMYSQAYLTIYGGTSPSHNVVQAFCDLAYQRWLNGEISECIKILDEARGKFPVTCNHTLSLTVGRILHENALNRGRIREAEMVGQQLVAMSSPDTDCPGHIDALYRQTQVMVAYGRFTEAASALNELIERCRTRGLHMQSVPYHLLQAEVHLRAGSIIGALPYILQALALAESFNLDSVRAEGMVVLAQLRHDLNCPAEAIRHIQGVYSHVSANCPALVRARMHLVMAKCKLAMADVANPENELELALKSLEKAHTLFSVFHAVDGLSGVAYLQARIYHQLGRIDERDNMARQFRTLAESVHSGDTTGIPYFFAEDDCDWKKLLTANQ